MNHDVLFQGSTWLNLDKSLSRKLIAKKQLTKNVMFSLNLRSVNIFESYAQNVSNAYDTLLLNSRFGHLPFKSINLLQKKSTVKGLHILNEHDSPCEICIHGKHKRDNFPTFSNRGK
jgi:hypothetical protein